MEESSDWRIVTSGRGRNGGGRSVHTGIGRSVHTGIGRSVHTGSGRKVHTGVGRSVVHTVHNYEKMGICAVAISLVLNTPYNCVVL